MQQGLFVQNYTSVGYKVVDCPKALYAKLKAAFHKKFADKNKVRVASCLVYAGPVLERCVLEQNSLTA
jgi:hypothetical protein